MLQGRLFAYGDAHRCRLGIDHTQLPVNAPKGVAGGATNYGRDGAMRFDANGGRAKKVKRTDIVERSVEHFRRADPEFGERLSAALKERR
jgi:catalase